MTWPPILYALAVSLAGVAVFHLLHLPLPWLLGPLAFCLGAALLGLPLGGIAPLNDGMRTILGVAVGATLTPAALASFVGMWATLLMVPAMILVIGLVGVPYFRRFCGYDLPTAYYAAMPGGLQDMVLFGEEAGGDPRALSLIHATRLLIVVVVLPILLTLFWTADLTASPGAPATELPLSEMLLMVFCALAGWMGAKRMGMFGASILGPLILTACFAIVDLLHHRPPAEAIWAAQFFIGMGIGSKYTGITGAEVRRDLRAGLGFCVILMLLTFIAVEICIQFGLAPSLDALLALAPGGQAEMVVLALIVGADTAFVVAHHVLRIFAVILGAPLAARLTGQ